MAKSKAAAEPVKEAGPPIIESWSDAMDEAVRRNLTNQAVIRAKKGAAKAIYNLVSSDVTNDVLQSPDRKYYKGMEEYTLYEVMADAIAGADRPATADVLNQLLEVINFAFDFSQKGQCKCRALQSKSRQDSHLWH